jgi:hypothetical protein
VKLAIEIDVDNATFEFYRGELRRILSRLARRMPDSCHDYSLYHTWVISDSNGAQVGYAKIIEGSAKNPEVVR